MKFVIVLAAVTALVSGCSTTARCSGEQDYQRAQTLPTPAPVADVKAPDSAAALKIPPPPARTVGYGEKVLDPKKPGKTKLECLDTPPAMPEPAPEPVPAPAKS